MRDMNAVARADEIRAIEAEGLDDARVEVLPRWLLPSVLGAIIVGGLVLRVWGIEMGLPLRLHPDEWRVVMRAMALGTGDLDPRTADVGHLMIYLSFILFGIYGGLGLLTGQFQNVHDIGVSFCLDPSAFYLLSRGISVVAGMAAIVLVFLIGQRLRGPWAGAAAAALLAVNPVHVERSHLAYPDALMVALMLGALYLMLPGQTKWTRGRHHFAIGLLVGLAASAKYIAVFLVPAYMSLLVYEAWGTRMSVGRTAALGGLCAAGCIVGFATGSPYALVHAPNTVRTIVGRSGLDHDDFASLGEFATSEDGLRRTVRALVGAKGVGWAGGILALVGIAFLPGAYRGYGIALAFMLLLNSVWVIHHGRFFARWLFPSTIGLTIMAGVGAAAAISSLCRGLPRPSGAIGAVIILSVLAWPHLHPALTEVRTFAAPHTQVVATDWIEANISGGSAIVIAGSTASTPQPRANRESLERMAAEAAGTDNPDYANVGMYYRYEMEAADRYAGPTYDIHKLKHTWWRPDEVPREQLIASRERIPVAPGHDVAADLERYLEAGVAYVVTTEHSVRQYCTADFPRDRAFYCSLARIGKLIWDLGPDGEMHGPHILIFATPNAPDFAAIAETTARAHWRASMLGAAAAPDVTLPGRDLQS